jgi:steroid 5-alpha reductase family enzyme
MSEAGHTTSSKTQDLVTVTIAYIACIAGGIGYLELFAQGNILLDSFLADVVATCVIFAFSRKFKNSSFYDAYWSVIPPLFLLFWYYQADSQGLELRYLLVSIVVWFWAIRLTYNWAKHWPGLCHEDWRYPLLKEKSGKFEFITDFFAIHFFPTVQVFLGMLPMFSAVYLSDRPVNLLDYIALIVGVSAVSIQLIADRQLHQFIAIRKPGEIIQHGLWAYSRHPNYFGELSFWISLALFGLAAYPEGWWWQILGVIAMLAMFLFASIPMMEERSLERRPEYQDIIDRISMLVPWPQKKAK